MNNPNGELNAKQKIEIREKRARRNRQLRMRRFFWVAVLLMILSAFIVYYIEKPKDETATNSDSDTAASSSSVAASITPESELPTPTPVASVSSVANIVDNEDVWQMSLINEENPLPADFKVELTELKNGKEVDSRIIENLQLMLDDGNATGLSMFVTSAFRSIERQDYLFTSMKNNFIADGMNEEEAYNKTKTIRAPYGSSEHSSGLAVDIVAVDYQVLDDGYADTPEAKWLYENAANYGFIMRYSEEKQPITGIIYEPWHYRYVGIDNAKAIKASGLCLEEYLA